MNPPSPHAAHRSPDQTHKSSKRKTASPTPGSQPRPLPDETVEDVHELAEPLRPLRFAALDTVGHARGDVKLEHRHADAVEGGLGGRQLLEDLDAEASILNHPANAADLTLDAIQADDEGVLMFGFEHGDTICPVPSSLECAMAPPAAQVAVDRPSLMNEHSFMSVTASRRRPAVPRTEKIDKRDALLRAAIATFAARGFFNAQVADVARTAGVAAGTVYLYFRGKDDLLVSIFEQTMKEAIAVGRRTIATLPDPLAQLHAIARLHLDRMSGDRDLAVVFQIELRQSTKFMERFSATHVREYLGIIRDVIADGQTAGLFRHDINPTLAAKLFFGMLDEMATNWILSKRRYSLGGEADAIVDLFVRGIGGAGA